MNNDEITCQTDSNKNVIDKEVYERELQMCKKLSQENGGKCAWGVCQDCGVIPFLHKLHKGELLEDPKEIKKAKSGVVG
ncbi:MAG: hypothetical protein KAS01_02665 [Candidatus Pacebacteria bacterium]|nr:hypothetical protein [Candidatus Paceibacterota bacterium]